MKLGQAEQVGNNRAHAPVVGGLVRAVVEHLEEVRSPHVKHELRVERKLARHAERIGIVSAVLSKFVALESIVELCLQPFDEIQ